MSRYGRWSAWQQPVTQRRLVPEGALDWDTGQRQGPWSYHTNSSTGFTSTPNPDDIERAYALAVGFQGGGAQIMPGWSGLDYPLVKILEVDYRTTPWHVTVGHVGLMYDFDAYPSPGDWQSMPQPAGWRGPWPPTFDGDSTDVGPHTQGGIDFAGGQAQFLGWHTTTDGNGDAVLAIGNTPNVDLAGEAPRAFVLSRTTPAPGMSSDLNGPTGDTVSSSPVAYTRNVPLFGAYIAGGIDPYNGSVHQYRSGDYIVYLTTGAGGSAFDIMHGHTRMTADPLLYEQYLTVGGGLQPQWQATHFTVRADDPPPSKFMALFYPGFYDYGGRPYGVGNGLPVLPTPSDGLSYWEVWAAINTTAYAVANTRTTAWRYWIPNSREPNLRLSQRNDGMANTGRAPRLTSSSSPPSSMQTTRSPRLGTNNRYR